MPFKFLTLNPMAQMDIEAEALTWMFFWDYQIRLHPDCPFYRSNCAPAGHHGKFWFAQAYTLLVWFSNFLGTHICSRSWLFFSFLFIKINACLFYSTLICLSQYLIERYSQIQAALKAGKAFLSAPLGKRSASLHRKRGVIMMEKMDLPMVAKIDCDGFLKMNWRRSAELLSSAAHVQLSQNSFYRLRRTRSAFTILRPALAIRGRHWLTHPHQQFRCFFQYVPLDDVMSPVPALFAFHKAGFAQNLKMLRYCSRGDTKTLWQGADAHIILQKKADNFKAALIA